MVKITKSSLSGTQKKEFSALVGGINRDFEVSLNAHTNAPKEEGFDSVIAF